MVSTKETEENNMFTTVLALSKIAMWLAIGVMAVSHISYFLSLYLYKTIVDPAVFYPYIKTLRITSVVLIVSAWLLGTGFYVDISLAFEMISATLLNWFVLWTIAFFLSIIIKILTHYMPRKNVKPIELNYGTMIFAVALLIVSFLLKP